MKSALHLVPKIAPDAICKHCDRPAEWQWVNPLGGESAFICQRCMDTVGLYQDVPLRHFEVLAAQSNHSGRSYESDVTYRKELRKGREPASVKTGYSPRPIEADSPVRAGRDESAFLEEFLAVDILAKARDYLREQYKQDLRRGGFWYVHFVANLQARQILNDCLSRLVDKIQSESEGA